MDSPPLRRFLISLGRAQYQLHTIVVGLSAIERGVATKPDDLDISWKVSDPIDSAREARRFLLRATLVVAAEDLNEYATEVLKYRKETIPEHREDRLRKLVRAEEVDPSYLPVAPLLISHWRNRIVHRRSRARLTSAEEDLLTSQSASIHDSFKHLNVFQLLKDFDADQLTLKNVTVLLAMSTRFVRMVDSLLPKPADPGQVRLWLEAEEVLSDVLTLEKEARNGGSSDPRRRGKQFLLTHSPTLADPYFYGFSPDLVLREVILGPRCELPIASVRAIVERCRPSVDVLKSRIAFRSFRVVEHQIATRSPATT